MAQRRYSKQRELIFEAVCGTNEHPTAETVYHWLKPDNPALSLGTVYRNLNLLADEGRLLRLPLPVERFDANTAPHAHFRCRLCGRVYDLDGLDYNAGLDTSESLGILLEIENAKIAAAYRRAHEPGFEATFIGYSPRGLQLRVSYFDAAVLLPPAPLRVPALAARGRRPDPASTHTQPRRGNARS